MKLVSIILIFSIVKFLNGEEDDVAKRQGLLQKFELYVYYIKKYKFFYYKFLDVHHLTRVQQLHYVPQVETRFQLVQQAQQDLDVKQVF